MTSQTRHLGVALSAGTYLLVALTVAPLIWLVTTALKTRVDAFAYPPQWLFTPTLDNFQSVLTGDFVATYLNSIVIVCVTTALSLLFGITSGYTLARATTRPTRVMGLWIILVRMAPAMAFALPFFLMFRYVGLLDTFPALILVYLTITLPFATWLMAGYFRDLPVDLDEAARVDGCSRIGALFRVVLPAARPGVATAGIFSFISAWNEFFYPLVIAGRTTKPAPVALQGFISSSGLDWGRLSAAGVLVLLPVLLFTLFAQRGIIQGLTQGTGK